MIITDQHDRPIEDIASLPVVEMATSPDEETAATHGKNGKRELPAIMGTTSADDMHDEAERARILAGLPESICDDPKPDSEDPKVCQRDYMVARLRHIRERLVAYAEQTSDRKHLCDPLISTAQSLDLAIAGAAVLPSDWKPVRPAASPTERKAGDHVVIKSKYRATYQDDLTAEDMDDMVVMRVGEKRLRCHCVASGAGILIPAGHVENK